MHKDDRQIEKSATEARQGQRSGVIWVLLGSLVLAAIAAVVLNAYL
ncbi:hypothetical protein [Methyloceanibacter caenitepidi]|uniref:Uncharacterized protein n=1 Tax=Methyloceanibacter caenitepidi TaxID=1384459 RepID=A0A0A8JYF3_9HYPH|nr:hypothetical protein [Methyloceanibacter caenitepidi]BAQ15630.1 hypothetical protein GL4_0160 [Methyloceanibacter caenitepidi]